jgi:hypothetical protein
MAEKTQDLDEIFTVKLTRDVSNFPSDGDIDYIRNKYNIAKGKAIAIFNESGEWVSTHTA